MKKILLAYSLFLLSSCATQIDHKLNTAVFLTPEAQGTGRFSAGIGQRAAPILNITDDISRRPPDRTSAVVEQETKIFLQGAAGIWDNVDFSLDPGHWLDAKVQLVGEPFSRAAKGNFSAAAFGSAWAEKEDDRDDFNTKGIDSTYEKKSTSWRLGALTGYRFANWFLVYGGVNYQRHIYHGIFEIRGGRRGSYAGSVDAKTANLGVEFSLDKNFAIRLEDAYSVARVPSFGGRSSQHSLGLMFAGLFGAPAASGAAPSSPASE